MKERLAAAARGYYYLTPVWLLTELFLFPGWRAGAVLPPGISPWAFYAVEGALGFAFWKGLPFAGRVALAENVLYLMAIVKFLVVTPMDIAMMSDGDPAAAAALGQTYIDKVPGMVCSGLQIAAHVSRELSGRTPTGPAGFARIER